MKRTTLMIIVLVVFASMVYASQVIEYNDSWSDAGFSLGQRSSSGVTVNYSINEFTLNDIKIGGENLVNVLLPDVLLQNDEGAPNLAGGGRLIALPQGSYAKFNIVSKRTEIFSNIEVAPAPRIPLDTDDSPLEYNKNQTIYSKDAFYPASPIKLGKQTQMRGVDVVMLGITPFQYNPVTKELIVYRDLQVEVEFIGGNGHFGADNLRSRWWDPILNDNIINYESLPVMDYTLNHRTRDGAEYLIISPDDVTFLAWADSIKTFRTKQGISTIVMTTNQVGGNTTSAIESFIDGIMDPTTGWDPAPAAILLLGDHGTMGNSIVSPIYNDYCVSDNIYADVSGNSMPDVVLARMTAQNATHLETMITKFLDYERAPPTETDFYDHPITALGFQTERWFQICSEAVAGFMEVEFGKTANRINAIYTGTPSTTWSTATNTATVVNYFGPNGLGYIPATPAEVNTSWYGTANDVINGINDGAFMLQHRDHGSITGWGEPDFQSSHISSLTNTDLPFIFSINCLTGKYNVAGECFAETFHRYTYNGENSGALGVLAASEVSYSFVNDAYVWGVYDNLWPEFMPDYGTTPDSRAVLPAFGNAAGKYFLEQSSWPYNTNNKEVTYNLFHHHGDAFTTVYSEIPQNLTVSHNPALLSGTTIFDVTANEGALIALSVAGELIGVAEGTGYPVSVTIDPQIPPADVDIVITLQNFYRYEAIVSVIPPDGPYVIFDSFTLNDDLGNGNGMLDYDETISLDFTISNIGSELASYTSVTISSADDYITMINATTDFGEIAVGELATVNDAFEFEIANDIPDGHTISFIVEVDGGEIWVSYFSINSHAPILTSEELFISDMTGNDNGKLDPGETVTIYITNINSGSSTSPFAIGTLTCANPLITIIAESYILGEIIADESIYALYSVYIDPEISIGTSLTFEYEVEADGYSIQTEYYLPISNPNVEDFETNNFESFEWDSGGSANWVIDTESHEGLYSAKSGVISDNQTTDLIITMEVVADGNISFYRKVSSEGGWDFLKFYINGQQRGSWSGETEWIEETYLVTAGTNTFKWEYIKDSSVFNGSDCAWIDYIVFPPLEIANPFNPPTNLQADIVEHNDITLTWDAPGVQRSENVTLNKKSKLTILGKTSITDEESVYRTRFLAGFKVYRDGIEIVEIVEPATLTYLDTALNAGNYVYTVTAVYDDGESYHSNPEIVNVTLPTPTDVTAQSQDSNVVISWVTPSRGINCYNVYRDEVLIAGDVMNSPYEDLDVPNGTYMYNVTTVYDGDWESEMSEGIELFHDPVNAGDILPLVTELTGNYPNPFNPTTTISFSTKEAGHVSISIYNTKGQLVKTLVNENLDAAYHNVVWNGKDNSNKITSSGIYFYKMKSSNYSSTRKMILMK